MGFNVRVTALLVLMAATLSGYAQERILGTWKTFMPFGTSLAVCDAGDKIYSAAAKSVFSYEKATGVIQIYDKSNALSDVDIKTISYDPATKCLAIAYNNANIDLIFNGTDVYNISDIKAENTSGSVGINGIYFYNGDCYLSTDIGIAVINLERKEISNTYVIGSSGAQIKVYATSINGNNIYAATQEGVKHASLNSSNLLNFSSWSLYSEADSLPTRKATYVASLGNYMYAVISNDVTDTLYQYNGTYWSPVYSNTSEVFSSLNTSANGNIYFTTINNVNYSTSKQGQVNQSGTVSVFAPQGHIRPAAWFDDNGTHWEADLWNGLFKNSNGNIENIKPDGPFTADDYGLATANGALYIAGGGTDDSWGLSYNRSGASIYKNNKWIYKNESVDPQLTDITDVLAVASVPATGKTYFGSFFGGLIEYNDNTNTIDKVYNKNNSPLEGTQGDSLRTKISALYTDKHNNLWIGNAGAYSAIKMIRPDGTWKSFQVPFTFEVMKNIIVDQNDQLWAPLRSTIGGVLVWSYNGTPDDPSDDVSKILRSGAGSGNLPDANTYCVAEDKDGNIWVGTNQGIAVYYCASSILGNYNCDADLIKVERDGYIGYLFSTESVRAIAVDAANRKWVGTTNGVWLISADGKTELLKFSVDNSPLPSNQITDIAIDDNSGEVFIGTTGGLVSYQGDAVSQCQDCDKALVYPNPVRPDYTGPIAIKGLVDDAYVKITDVSGALIYQGKANGSQMIWDGKGYNGNRAKSGVYLVFSSTELGKEKQVAKILLAN
jgi:hypothetical protein